jgi:Na+-driven multidrug efflux pump
MTRPALSTVAEILKPITWFPPMWAFACGVVASGVSPQGHWLLIFAGIITVFDGLQATASFALRAQGMVWLPSAIHLGSFFVVMLPLCKFATPTTRKKPVPVTGARRVTCAPLRVVSPFKLTLVVSPND